MNSTAYTWQRTLSDISLFFAIVFIAAMVINTILHLSWFYESRGWQEVKARELVIESYWDRVNRGYRGGGWLLCGSVTVWDIKMKDGTRLSSLHGDRCHQRSYARKLKGYDNLGKCLAKTPDATLKYKLYDWRIIRLISLITRQGIHGAILIDTPSCEDKSISSIKRSLFWSDIKKHLVLEFVFAIIFALVWLRFRLQADRRDFYEDINSSGRYYHSPDIELTVYDMRERRSSRIIGTIILTLVIGVTVWSIYMAGGFE